MRLTTEQTLRNVTELLSKQVAPAVHERFASEAIRMSLALLTICANTADNAAAVRVDEHAKLRLLFADATSIVTNEDLCARLAAAAQSHDPGLQISILDGETARLRTLLVELHTYVELLPDAANFTQRIWDFLAETETNRAPKG